MFYSSLADNCFEKKHFHNLQYGVRQLCSAFLLMVCSKFLCRANNSDCEKEKSIFL